jgi:hypothetical protein
MAYDDWTTILEKVRSGEISAAEAEQLLRAVDEQPSAASQASPGPDPEPQIGTSEVEDPLKNLGWWKNAWLIPVWVGTGVLVLSAWLLSWGYASHRFFWFYCSWLPLLLGMGILLIGVWSRQARWAHVRIQDSDGTKISISVPLPIRLASWALHTFAPRIPELKKKHLEALPDILNAMEETRDPITVEVDEKGGDHVRVFIQ